MINLLRGLFSIFGMRKHNSEPIENLTNGVLLIQESTGELTQTGMLRKD